MGNRRPPDRDAAPVAQRVRIRYARRGRLRFSSHRDFQRALERAIRRAGLPIAFKSCSPDSVKQFRMPWLIRVKLPFGKFQITEPESGLRVTVTCINQ